MHIKLKVLFVYLFKSIHYNKILTMQLRSGFTTNKTMRRDSRNYEEFNEQKQKNENPHTTNDLRVLRKYNPKYRFTFFAMTMRRLMDQLCSTDSSIEQIKTFLKMYTLIYDNSQFLIENNYMTKFADLFIELGDYYDKIASCNHHIRTRSNSKLLSECRQAIYKVQMILKIYI
jgi:hypothetical protein